MYVLHIHAYILFHCGPAVRFRSVPVVPQKKPPVDLSWLPKVWTIALSPNGSVSAAPGGLDGQPWWSGRIKVTITKRDLGRPLD